VVWALPKCGSGDRATRSIDGERGLDRPEDNLETLLPKADEQCRQQKCPQHRPQRHAHVDKCFLDHGANRLASNSLLEGLVFSARIAADIAAHTPEPGTPVENASREILLDPSVRGDIQKSMSRGAGVLRSSDSLLKTSADLTRIEDRRSTEPCVEAWEATNLFQLAQAILKAALIRQETRGSHWREDFPETSDLWRKRIIQSVDQSGSWTTGYQEVGDQ
jgi:L-aspartate oxidase